MPNILLAWELGSGLGHLVPLRAIGLELVRRGQRVAIAANNVPLCQQGFAGTGVEVYPAPQLSQTGGSRFPAPTAIFSTMRDTLRRRM
jgi:UDP:flavonoid glycosyltransferase YjiC (YdhE family)